jgi:tetratricopeptide (TPR) repeat protein
MAKSDIFVGRKEELEEFTKVLEDKRGQAVIVVGNRGMGKTWLVNQMAKLASEHHTLKCGWVRYEVTPTDSPDSTMAMMMDNAFDAGQVAEGSFDGTRRGLEQWRSFLNVFNLGDLVMSLRREQTRDTRQQFLERLELISKRMPGNGRAIFIIDPEKYMAKEGDQTWAIVVKSLPEKIKFIFAQRTEDEIVKGRAFKGLKNVIWIPKAKLDVLASEEVDDLVRLRAKEVGQEEIALRGAVKRYKGHPYAIQAALGIIEKTKTVKGLPQDPTEEGVAEGQWEQVSDIGEDAIKLFEAYAVLEVAVTDDVVECVSMLGTTTRKQVQGDKYLRGLLREEAGGRRIYHSILADYILGQMSEAEKKEYHKRAMKIYRGKLKKAKKEQTKPDELAAVRLAEHVLAAEGEKAFVDAFVNECAQSLIHLGLLDAAIGLTARMLKVVEKNSKEEARVLCLLGVIYDNRCELNKAEETYLKALEINGRHGYQKGMSTIYGNLGVTYYRSGELTKAEDVLMAGLRIDEQLGDSLGMAGKYSNLGLIYKTRGEFYKAQKMYQKSLEIFEGSQQLEEVGTVLGNIGVIYTCLGDINNAEKMHRKALLIDKRLGRLEGVSRHSGNLGVVYKEQGRIEDAAKMFRESVKIDEQLGNLTGMSTNYGNLGVLYAEMGELDKAEEMQKKALAIDEKVGHLEGVARHSSNLGVIYKKRGDICVGKKYWEKARDLYKRIGMANEVKKVEGWIEEIKGK